MLAFTKGLEKDGRGFSLLGADDVVLRAGAPRVEDDDCAELEFLCQVFPLSEDVGGKDETSPKERPLFEARVTVLNTVFVNSLRDIVPPELRAELGSFNSADEKTAARGMSERYRMPRVPRCVSMFTSEINKLFNTHSRGELATGFRNDQKN